MRKLKFFLIGDGRIAQYHKEAIKKLEGDIYIYDPIKSPHSLYSPFGNDLELAIKQYNPDYAVICSYSNLHRLQTQIALKYGYKVIVEKPAVLPWETLVDNDNIHIVLQLRYLENLPEKAELIKVGFVRDKEYFKSWKGDSKLTGGIFYNLFIHYIDLAIRLDAKLEGTICSGGAQIKKIYAKEAEEEIEFVGSPNGKRHREAMKNNKSYLCPLGLSKFIKANNAYHNFHAMATSTARDWMNTEEPIYTDSDGNIHDGIITLKPETNLQAIDMQVLYHRMYEDVVLNKNHIKPRDIFYLNWVLDRCNWDYGLGNKDILGKKITFDPNEL